MRLLHLEVMRIAPTWILDWPERWGEGRLESAQACYHVKPQRPFDDTFKEFIKPHKNGGRRVWRVKMRVLHTTTHVEREMDTHCEGSNQYD